MQPPTTPPPNAGDNARITDYFPPIKQSGHSVRSKRDIDETSTEDRQPAKRRKVDQDHSTTNSFRTGRPHVDVDTPKRKKTPSSARLLDDTDLGLRDRVVGRRDFMEEESGEDEAKSPEEERPKATKPIRAPVSVNNHKRKRPASSRLLDEVDGGLWDSLAGRFETPRYEEKPEASRAGGEKKDDEPAHDTLDDDSEAETIRAYDSEDDMSSVENRDNEDSDEDSDEGEDSEGDDSDKENVDPRDRYRAPSPPSLPATPQHHQSHETADANPSNQSSASPSSLLLPSPVVDLPPLPSSPSSSSTLVPVPPSTMPSPPSSQ